MTPEEITRRRFLEKLCIGLSGICAAILGIPLVGFVVAPIFRKTTGKWISIGNITDYEVGKTVSVTITDPSSLPWAGITAKSALWLRRVNEARIHRVLGQLHTPGMSGALARRRGVVHVPVSRRSLLLRWNGRGGTAAKAVDPLRRADRKRPGANQNDGHSDHHYHQVMKRLVTGRGGGSMTGSGFRR